MLVDNEQVYTAQSEARALAETKGEMETLMKEKEEEVTGLEEKIKALEDVGQKSEVLHEEIEGKKKEIARLTKVGRVPSIGASRWLLLSSILHGTCGV